MDEHPLSDPQNIKAEEQDYLDVGPGGPRGWILALGALIVGAAIVAAFYGLYKLNTSASPTPSPDPFALTRAAAVGASAPIEVTPTPTVVSVTATPTLTTTVVLTPTAEPPTFTVQQGDTLIGIAARLNVDVDDLRTLNQISGETIYPNQILLVPPTVTPWPATGPFPHVVSQGETLISIAARYQVTVDELKTLNGLTSDTIFSGQKILIPASGVRPPTPTPTPTPWAAAVITGELDAAHSLTTIKGHFTLHIAPDTRSSDPDETARVADLVEKALDDSQRTIGRQITGRFDVYVADTLFAPPYTPRRSFSEPDDNRLFILYDGSGASAERQYLITHALTPLIAARTLGEGASPLLVEGLAVYAGGQALAATGGQYLTLEQLCLAYAQANQMPRVSRELTFEGHLGYTDQYLAAGCFVGYLIETQGVATFEQVYTGGDYRAVYGRTLDQLESEWIASLVEAQVELPFDPAELVRIAAEIDDAYRRLWAEFEGAPAQFAIYERLDRARLALLQGRLGAAQEHLELAAPLLETP